MLRASASLTPVCEVPSYALTESALPVVFTTMAFEKTAGPGNDVGTLGLKCPLEVLQAGTDAVKIDDRIAPRPGEQVIPKKNASAFHGTHLSNYLTALRVDTVVVVCSRRPSIAEDEPSRLTPSSAAAYWAQRTIRSSGSQRSRELKT